MIFWKHLTITVNPQTAPYRASAWVKWAKEDNCFIAICPEFKHISTHGDTEQEAINELIVTLSVVEDVYQEYGWTLPDPLSD